MAIAVEEVVKTEVKMEPIEVEYPISITFNIKDSYNLKLVCACGYTDVIENKFGFECPQCKNKKQHHIYKESIKRVIVGSDYETVSKTDKSFVLEKINKIAIFDKNGTFKISNETVGKLEFSFVNKNFLLFKGNETRKMSDDRSRMFDSFFQGLSRNKFLCLATTDNNRSLFEFALNRFGAENGEKTDKIARSLYRLLERDYMETLYFAGFKSMKSVYDCIRNNRKYYYGDNYRMNPKGNSPQEILGVPKYAVSYFREMEIFHRNHPASVKEFDEKFGGNNVKIILDIVLEETNASNIFNMSDIIIDLYEKYEYKDIKKLILYGVRDVKLQQGITDIRSAFTLLRDYVRMSNKMNVEYERYPKSLKKVHDIAAMNYKVKESEMKKKDFQEKTCEESYDMLRYKGKDYEIITPQEPGDLIVEGRSLNHCVASYIDDVIRGSCKILFMRKTDDVEHSLLTIEVRNNNVRQIKGVNNRAPRQNEMSFINKWAEKKNLKVSVW